MRRTRSAAEHRAPQAGRGTPWLAGVVTAVVGFSSSFVVVLAGLGAVGASPAEAASGLLVLCLAQAAGMLWLSLRHRTPLTLAWSTPGAALLLTSGAADGGWPAAVGAFVLCGVLVALTGLVPWLGALVARIPPPIARAMLAGVLVPICLEPVTGLVDAPLLVGPVVATWLLVHLVSRRWAVPAALAVALLVALVDVLGGPGLDSAALVPTLTWTTPEWTLGAVLAIALPLYVVTMASQNVPGVAVMAGHGYAVPWRESMGVTGLATVAAAPFGGHAVNLAAITAAMAAGPLAGADRSRRWLASVSAAATYAVLALASGALVALLAAAPPEVLPAAAGLALLGTLGASLAGALADEDTREASVVCFVVAASGVTVLGIGAAPWALVAALVVLPFVRDRSAPAMTEPGTGPGTGAQPAGRNQVERSPR
ncbi:benzoate/H(+) symporter BenE family transporter [Nocardioides sp. zg-DK7169]|uniref:benzoate/H(+) symporter BenE family transporter n=1 Tax=Nocardioides sp. zg-DK7169 TaxID=2736600 RepID=UPI001553EB97|nr:benzoate/H(+) symporter BenE family transporter [Nocardioides sp. zg-DK7169]NPC95689.1 benzoate/H(+) symporter BenE family transporter [Nocardioides sp. zg-DK7169]